MTEGRAGSWPEGDGPERHGETGGWPPPAPNGPGGTPRSGQSPPSRSAEPAPPPWSAGSIGPGAPAGPTDPYAAGGSDPPGGPDGAGPAGSAPWAPGDAAYGRLGGGDPARPGRPTPPTRPARPAPRRVATRGRTPITLGLIAVNVVVYLLQSADPSLTYRYGLLPLAVEAGQYERLLTSTFLHGGLLHLAFNMLALYIVGAPLERVLGTGRYLTIYLASALGGSLLAMLLSPPDTLGVGASGAVFGLFGALIVLRDRVGAEAGGVVTLIGINLVISFLVPGISWQAHLGGLLTGVVVAFLVRGRARPG